MKQMETLTLPNGTTYEIVDRQARNSIAKNHANPITETLDGTVVASKYSAESPLRNLRLFGKTNQVTTTGKNLMNDSEYINSTSQGITVNRRYDGSYTVSGTASTTNVAITRIGEVVMTAGTKYRISGGKSNVRLTLRDYSMGTVYADDTGSGTSYTPDTDMTAYLYTRVEMDTTVNTVLWPMVYLDSVANTTWEPYTGGAASPSVAYPQDLTSCGDDGTIEIDITGGNLFDAASISTDTNKALMVSDDRFTVTVLGGSDTGYASSTVDVNPNVVNCLRGKTVVFTADEITRTQANIKSGPQVSVKHSGGTDYYLLTEASTREIVIPDDVEKIRIGVYANNTGSALELDNSVTVKGLRLSTVKMEWSKFIPKQSMTVDYTLRGIPVISGGNYIDANGKQWLCDEIDFERGVHIQRIGSIAFRGSSWYQNDPGRYYCADGQGMFSKDHVVMCTHVAGGTASSGSKSNAIFINANNHIRLNIELEDDTVEAVADVMNDAVLYGVLVTPIHTTLTSDELALYENIHTNYPSSIILNDSGAYMEATYNADTKNWIVDYVSNMI